MNQYAAAVQGAAALGAYTHQPTTAPLQFYPGTNTTPCWALLYQYSGTRAWGGFKLCTKLSSLQLYLLATTDQIDQQSTKPFLDTCWKRFDDHSCVPTAATYSNPGQAAAPAITAGHHNTWSLVPTAAVAPAAHGWPASGLNSGGYYDLASLYQHQVTSKINIIFVDGWRNQIVENRGFEGGFCNLLKEIMPFLTDSHFEFGSDDEGSSR